jgi:hypothetical protein
MSVPTRLFIEPELRLSCSTGTHDALNCTMAGYLLIKREP